MEKDGLVDKRAGADKRAIALFVTDQGKKSVKRIVRARRRCLEEVLAVLPASEHKQLSSMLERMLGLLTTDFYSGEAICKLCEVNMCPQEHCPVAKRQVASATHV
jgi:hypothetical protein